MEGAVRKEHSVRGKKMVKFRFQDFEILILFQEHGLITDDMLHARRCNIYE